MIDTESATYSTGRIEVDPAAQPDKRHPDLAHTSVIFVMLHVLDRRIIRPLRRVRLEPLAEIRLIGEPERGERESSEVEGERFVGLDNEHVFSNCRLLSTS